MKRMLLSFAMGLVVLTSVAQGTWKKVQMEADELRGVEAGSAYVYEVPNVGELVLWDWDKFQYRLVSYDPFALKHGYTRFTGSYTGVTVLVGIYDDQDKLIEKFDMFLDDEKNRGNRFIRTRDLGGMNNPVGQKKKVRKIFTALRSGKGYVRFVAPRYNKSDFDIKVMPYKE